MPEEPSSSLLTVEDVFGFSKPCVTLIEKISDALGARCRPKQIVNIARAEAEADVIRAHAEIQVADIRRQALLRFQEEQVQYQRNMEAMVRKALPQVNENAKPEHLDQDWLVFFLDKARLVSNDEMQNLWGRILAGESNKPGSFSKRTLSLVEVMDKRDAQAFTDLCAFTCYFQGCPWLLIYDHRHPIYASNGVSHDKLVHLESLGLIARSPDGGFVNRGLPREFHLKYFDQQVGLNAPAVEGQWVTGKALLTSTGLELLPICGSTKVPGFWEYLMDYWNVT